MKVEHTVYCSAPDCEVHQHLSQSTWETGRLPIGWVRLVVYGGSGSGHVEAFCHTDCAMRWCAAQAPLERYGDAS